MQGIIPRVSILQAFLYPMGSSLCMKEHTMFADRVTRSKAISMTATTKRTSIRSRANKISAPMGENADKTDAVMT